MFTKNRIKQIGCAVLILGLGAAFAFLASNIHGIHKTLPRKPHLAFTLLLLPGLPILICLALLSWLDWRKHIYLSKKIIIICLVFLCGTAIAKLTTTQNLYDAVIKINPSFKDVGVSGDMRNYVVELKTNSLKAKWLGTNYIGTFASLILLVIVGMIKGGKETEDQVGSRFHYLKNVAAGMVVTCVALYGIYGFLLKDVKRRRNRPVMAAPSTSTTTRQRSITETAIIAKEQASLEAERRQAEAELIRQREMEHRAMAEQERANN